MSAPPAPAAVAPPGRGARALLLLLAALLSAAVMLAQLTGPRLVARHLGTGLFTWAATIATFLGGLALGSAWGGRLADRHGRRVLPLLLLLAGAALHAVVPLDRLVAEVLPALGWAPVPRILVGIPVVFLAAAVLLGAPQPLLARLLVEGAERPGRRLGALSAAGSVGAVGGVLAAGYLLIPALPTPTILFGGATGVALLALPAALLARRAGAGPAPSTGPADGSAAPPAAPGAPAVAGLGGLAFLCGAAFLALEIVAGRVAVLALGSSLYTWTAVLAVMLLGGALGALLGGRHADRAPPRQAVGNVLAFGMLGLGVTLWTPMLLGRALPAGLPWPAATLLAVAAAFLVPAVMLGSTFPALTRAALAGPGPHGRVLGRMQALGTLGCVAGALLAAFVLIPLAGVPALTMLATLALATAADRVARSRALVPVRGVLVLLLVAVLAPPGFLGDVPRGIGLRLGLREDADDVVALRESGYYRIRVEDEPARWCLLSEPPDLEGLRRLPGVRGAVAYDASRRRLFWEGPPIDAPTLEALLPHVRGEGDREALRGLAARTHHTVRQMALDKLTHGFADLQDPTWVGYDYELVAAALWRHAPRAGRGQRAFFVGGGPYTFQRRLLALDPEARLVTAEIDPAVTQAALETLGLRADPRHRIVHEDARLALPASAPETFDVVFGDAFNDFSVPFHLTTREFAEAVRARLAPGGLYLVNVVDVWESGRFLSAFHATLGEVFAHTAVLALGPRQDGERETFLLVASDAPLPLAHLTDDQGRPLDVVRFGPEDLRALRRRTGARVLTDALAPVEALLAPVARRAAATAR